MESEKGRLKPIEDLIELVGQAEFDRYLNIYAFGRRNSAVRRQELEKASRLINRDLETLKRGMRQYLQYLREGGQAIHVEMPNYRKEIPQVECDSFLIFGCLHEPYTDRAKKQRLFDKAKELKVDVIIDAGDGVDNPLFDSHEKIRKPLPALDADEDYHIIKNDYLTLGNFCGRGLVLDSNHGNKVTRFSQTIISWQMLCQDEELDEKWEFSNSSYGYIYHPKNERGIGVTKVEHFSSYSKNPLELMRQLYRADVGPNTTAEDWQLWDYVGSHLHQFSVGFADNGISLLVSLGTFLVKDLVEYLTRNTTKYPQPTFGFMWYKNKKLGFEFGA